MVVVQPMEQLAVGSDLRQSGRSDRQLSIFAKLDAVASGDWQPKPRIEQVHFAPDPMQGNPIREPFGLQIEPVALAFE